MASPPATSPDLLLGDQKPEDEKKKIQIHKDREKRVGNHSRRVMPTNTVEERMLVESNLAK